jgi:hypothetical protein
MDDRFAAGRHFLLRQGRLLERRLFATCFENAAGRSVIDVLRGYANADGGFGHGLEPDKRCPASLPIDVEVALQAMVTARAVDPPLIRNADSANLPPTTRGRTSPSVTAGPNSTTTTCPPMRTPSAKP